MIEDDADWDVDIKKQLLSLAQTTRSPTHTPFDSADTSSESPYGSLDDWDLLWLGACANPPGGPDSLFFDTDSSLEQHMVFRARGGMSCLYGYAVNRRSARDLAGWLIDVDDPVDFEISE